MYHRDTSTGAALSVVLFSCVHESAKKKKKCSCIPLSVIYVTAYHRKKGVVIVPIEEA